ncbi:Rossmann-fold NAD(P)-binding domain-containing protein [Halalkalicoccus salilacus]|uniref:hypothetical protein n=1 Tax=Halalkalicoccus salilacus TaxID=3117459 RepID=UPI00300F41B0
MSSTVLITGCSSGIGHATSLDPSELADFEGVGCHTPKLDVTDSGDAEVVAERMIDEQGHIDCLFNNVRASLRDSRGASEIFDF